MIQSEIDVSMTQDTDALKKSLVLSQNPERQPQSKAIFSAAELLNMGIKEVPKLWDPFFPVKGVVGLTGSSDCGKSMFLRQFAMAIALQQKEFLGFPLNIRHGKAMYICTEDDYEGIAALLSRQASGLKPESLSNLHFVFEGKDLPTQVGEFLKTTKVDLIVLDVWSDTYTGNPNNWVDVRKNLSEIKEIAREHECLVVILHHTVKNSEKYAPDKSKLNGSQAIEAKLRALLELRNGEADNEKVLYVLKNNYMSRELKSDGLLLELDPEKLLLSNTGRKVSKSGSIGENGKTKFDPKVWVPRFTQLQKVSGSSIEKVREQLKNKYPNEDVPSATWFKNNYKDSVSQSESKENE